MWARQQLPSALVAIRVWSSLQVGTSDSQSSGSHSVTHRSKTINEIIQHFDKYLKKEKGHMETHHTRSPDSRSPVCSMTPASPHIYSQEGSDHTGSGYTLQSQTLQHLLFLVTHKSCFRQANKSTCCAQDPS